jgi:hypothetical protein
MNIKLLQISIIFVRKREGSSLVHLVLVLGHEGLVNLNLRRSKSGRSDKLEGRVADELSSKPEERFLKVVVGLGRDIVVLEILLSVESNGLGLDLTLLNIDLVTAENDGDVLADTDKITVPVGNVLVSDTGGNIKHDNTTLAVNVVTVTETAELLLTSSVPDLELNLTKVGEEAEGVDLDTLGSNVLLLEFTSQMALDEGSLYKNRVLIYSVLSDEHNAICHKPEYHKKIETPEQHKQNPTAVQEKPDAINGVGRATG